jgi:cell division protein FtsQ
MSRTATTRERGADAAGPRSGQLRAHRRRGLRRLGVLLVTVLGMVWLTYLALFSPVFGARSVEVVGVGLLSADEVRAVAAIPPGRPLLRLDVGAAADRVRGLPPVAQVRVERSWPATVTIRVTERQALAFTAVGGGAQLVDGAGLRFATVAEPPAGLPELTAAEGPATKAAAGVLATLSGQGHEAVRTELIAVRADRPFDVQLTLRGNRTVRWGGPEDSERKAAVLKVLLSQPGTVYDVASADLPTIR